ncbi:flavodoxin family protein [Nocardioides sp. WL0053]|jgi:multimeric flavodoxin WrbA|uniref:Flavodoxin family protein n=1 Tax=Nocardioides jiangsuensis TaxID=2866161 RepID=A0ABS7RJZ8_9ACTN|nr:flavodoxin family protein [Nocardioides jiangsuensis]MBY9075375.1 flavodoxin family protein [Nocardioides jiangsuensis]
MTELTALVLNCTLKPAPTASSSEVLGTEVLEALSAHGVTGDMVRVTDHQVKFGVNVDEGDGDGWPDIRRRMLDADILVIATPIWLGQPSAVCKMVLERLDAELGETDDEGRMLTYGKVGALAVVGNEDGAHHTSAEVFQALADVGFTIPPNGVTYWVGEAMQGTDYLDMDPRPEKTAQTTKTLAANAAHLARLLKASNYPAG